MATKLKNLVITKVALCEEGACSAAHIKLFKRRENVPMTYEEILKSLTPEQQEVLKAKDAEMDAKVSTAESDKKKAEEDKAKAEGEMNKAKEELAKAKAPTQTEEDLMKSLSPELQSIFKAQQSRLAAAEAIAKQAAEEQATSLAKSKVALLKSIPGEESAKVELIKSLNSKDANLANQVIDILEKANAVIEKGAAFTTAGSTGGDTGTAGSAEACYAAIEKAAEPIALAKSISKEQAVAIVIKEKPQLYQDYLNAL